MFFIFILNKLNLPFLAGRRRLKEGRHVYSPHSQFWVHLVTKDWLRLSTDGQAYNMKVYAVLSVDIMYPFLLIAN